MQLTIRTVTRRAAVPAVAVLIATAALAGCSASSSSSAPAAGNSSSPKVHNASHTTTPAPPTCPLTGARRRKGQVIKRVALAVKIDNVVGALPQSGVNDADVVFEELVEGGLTRLMAIFQCNSAPKIGPIRSLRISDADVLALLHGGSVFAYSGANPADVPPVAKHSGAELLSEDSNPQYYYRSGPNLAPHDVFSSTKKVLRAGVKRKKSLKAPTPIFSYGALDPSANKATNVSLSWPAATAQWQWSKGKYLRTQNGSRDTLTDGSQISAANVVIMNVKIADTGLHDVLGNPSPEDVTVGHGNVWVLRNGKVIKGVWHRKSVKAEFTYRDKQKKKILLSPGRTWVELLPVGRRPVLH